MLQEVVVFNVKSGRCHLMLLICKLLLQLLSLSRLRCAAFPGIEVSSTGRSAALYAHRSAELRWKDATDH